MNPPKKTFDKFTLLSLALLFTLSASADVILTDNFQVTANNNNVNQNLASRETGTLAPARYTGWTGNYQVGNTTTGVGQPGGAANGNYLLLAFGAAVFNDLNVCAAATGPLTIEYDLYNQDGTPKGDSTDWTACSLRAPGNYSPAFPVAGNGEFGFLVRRNGGIQAFQGGNEIAPGTWDTSGFAAATHFKLIFTDTAGTGSAFVGNGSQVTFVNGTTTLGTITLSQLNSAGLKLGWSADANVIGGIANLAVSGTTGVPPGQNLSFEYDTALPGQNLLCEPASWTSFNRNGPSDFGTVHTEGSEYTIYDPLAPTADGTNYYFINIFSGNPTGGIYQDMGALQPNTIYTLTVAIGNRNDTPPNGAATWSPGIISLINGTDNTGTVMATGGGVPSTPNTWQDYTTTFSTGGSVSGDLTVMLSVAGAPSIQADFDNVRLTAVQSPVPLPFLITNTTPASATVASGSNIVFTAAFSNSPPVSLQWQQLVNGSPTVTNNINTGVVTIINNGIVSSTLTLNNVPVTGAGFYRLEAANATNLVTVVYSTPAPLTVVPEIHWYSQGAYNGSFSDDTVLALAGPVANEVYGVDFGAGPQITANGYSFGDVSDTTANNMTLNGTLTSVAGYLPGSATTGDFSLDNVLNNGYAGSAGNTGTLNNLTVGQTYTVLVLLADDRTSGAGGSTFDVTDGITVSPAQQYAYPGGTPEVGGYIMGTFTAEATTQPLTVLNNNNNSQYNAVLLMTGIAPPPPNPPVLTADVSPLLSEVYPGTPITLSVAAAGATTLQYQWSDPNGPISNQTNSSYTFNAVAGDNYFSVIITNNYGSVTSSIAEVISSTNIVNVANFSFEADVTPNNIDRHLPITGWTAFNAGASDWIGTGHPTNNQYSVNNPLGAPASGNQYCWVNNLTVGSVDGLYQDVGPLQNNTVYTLTVAIGSRADRINSPGVISLVRGTDNTGAVVATTTGLPATQDTWQDYTVTFTNGTLVGDLTIELANADPGAIQADFDNVRLTKAPSAGPPPPPAIHNPSFELDNNSVPGFWTAFNDNDFSIAVTENGGNYTVFDPLAAPADGTNFFAINEGPSQPATGGIYQVYDALKPNTIYTLTVAIGHSHAAPVTGQTTWSPGIISLINGDNNTGTVLATGGGLPATADTWQDYTASYATGPSVSGDLTVELSVAPAPTYQAQFDNVRLTLTPAPGVAPAVGAQVSGGNLMITGTGGSPNTGYTVLTTTNLSAPISWTTNSVGTLDGTGALSKSIPIGTDAARFYRVRVP